MTKKKYIKVLLRQCVWKLAESQIYSGGCILMLLCRATCLKALLKAPRDPLTSAGCACVCVNLNSPGAALK